MIRDHQHYYLHHCCVPVRGATRGTICDLQRNSFSLVPNELIDLLQEYKGKTIGSIKQDFGPEDQMLVDEYFDMLIEKEYVHLSDQPDPHFYPNNDPMKLAFESPEVIQAAVLDTDAQQRYSLLEVLKELDKLCCPSLQIRAYDSLETSFWQDLINSFSGTTFRNIHLLLPFTSKDYTHQVIEIASGEMRIQSCSFFSAPPNFQPSRVLSQFRRLHFQSENITSCSACGLITPYHFDLNTENYLIGRTHNTCLYKKVGVDVTGDISNCPSMPKKYGNVNKETISSAFQLDEFLASSKIIKDQIEVCRDCEFRHICTDCRAYTTDPDSPYAKPEKCSYDPYTNQWLD